MSFVSWQYLMLLVVGVPVYWTLPQRGRIYLLWAASYFFYGFWDARFLALIFTTTTADYFCALGMSGRRVPFARMFGICLLPAGWLAVGTQFGFGSARASWSVVGLALLLPALFPLLHSLAVAAEGEHRRRRLLWLSVGINLSVLGCFKYFNFFADSLITLLQSAGWTPGWTLPHILLPVGISFYTFQSLSYTVDVYRAKAEATEDFPVFATYLAFFPQLVAGPIERPAALLPQFHGLREWHPDEARRGVRLILVGWFKKVFVADNCALVANHVFAPAGDLDAAWAVLGTVAFAFQIYGDFSGYTDIARGSARLLGIHLSPNFRFPYFANGPSDFWQRWHITLSSWFRDYVYIPLGGNRTGSGKTLRNLFITMLLAGLWHGASWTFVLWGAFHGVLLIAYRVIPPLQMLEGNRAVPARILAPLVMFGFTLVGWALFRSPDFATFGRWCLALGNAPTGPAEAWLRPALWLLIHIGPLLLLQAFTWKAQDEIEFANWFKPFQVLTLLLLFLLVMSSTRVDQEFLYFQF